MWLRAPLGEEIGPSLAEVRGQYPRNYDAIPERRYELAGEMRTYAFEELSTKFHAGLYCSFEGALSLPRFSERNPDQGGAAGFWAIFDHSQLGLWQILVCRGLYKTPLPQALLMEIWGGNPFDEAQTDDEAYDYEDILRRRGIFVCGKWERRVEGLGLHERRAEHFKKWTA